MAIIKCKMCGGDIEISADKTFGTCEYCGSTMTLPKTDDDQRLSLFNRGTHLRRNGEFDKAAAIYERLIGENDADAEAHWNLLLCRYGIEYVQDPASGERIPTCHRASFDSILNDVDYQAARKYSDGVARSLYEKEAQRIAALQKDILAISQKETPFDVFICYKESDENGKRTKDSALAQDIYYQLTDAGYKVFFARITLEDKLGQEYEPYIFAALHSAKVMVVVGTKPEYLNAVWVKNEWSRYLALMRTDRSRLLIPCYRDMDPYDMPEELSMLQSQDMGKIGFIQDLIRGVKKVVDAAKPQEAVTETVKETVVVHNETSGNVQALLDRGQMALEDGEWEKADEFFEQVLNQDAKCGAAYLGKFLARVECRSAKAYADAYIENVKADAPNEKNADACEPDEAFITSCVEKYTVPGILSGNQIRQMLEFDLEYCEASSLYALRAEEAQEEFAADKDLMRAVKYASSEAKTITEDIPQTLDTLRRDAQKREDTEKARITAEYRKFLTETEATLEKEHPQRLKEAEEARKAEADRQRKAKAAEKKIAIVAGIATAVIALVLVIVNVIIPAVNYSKAEKLLAAGDYDGAITAFAALGDYKDASERKANVRNVQAYADAETLLAKGDYDGAIAAFTKLGEYQDAASRAKDAEAQKQETENAQAYASAEALLNAREYDSAAKAFDMLGDYKDAAARALECYYIEADQLQTQGKTAEAAFTFAKIAEYKDAQERGSALWDMIPGRETITTSGSHTAALKMDGTAISVGSYSNGERDIYDWNDIVDISCGLDHTVGLKSDGTVLAAGKDHFDYGQCDVSDWRNIIAVDAGEDYTVGLKADGTVVATGKDDAGQCDVSAWTNIVAISAGDYHTVGLKSDGTVTAVGAGEDGQCNIADWEDIVSISCGENHTAGLKADGTVVAVGNNEYGQCDVSRWFGIVAISAGDRHTVGLKADGTVIAVGDNRLNQCDLSDWHNIIDISCGDMCTVGLKSDGTALAIGWNYYGQCNVSNWADIKLPNK
jgi:tetratricopeptide (TPR) repeat protein